MNKTVMMFLVVSLTMAFAAYLYKDDLGFGKKTQEISQPAENADSQSSETEQAKQDS